MATLLKDPSSVDAITAEVEAYLNANQAKSLLRFITCGSVDDGKSTLIGRLLYDSKLLFEDQLSSLEADSRKFGTQGEEIDFALLVDGLAAEREQGITIDVAYRFFTTDKRKFIVADAPGHEQYTRNMVTGASTADLAIILIDARKGVLTQTRRHSYLASLLGIRKLVLAINKMDLIDYDQDRYDAIVGDYAAFARSIGIEEFTPIPISGLKGDNVTSRSAAMPWYGGPALLEHLEAVAVGDRSLRQAPFRMAVQWVNRPNSSFRGYAGTIAAGEVRPGDEVVVLPLGTKAVIERIASFDGDLDVAITGQSVTLTFTEEVDCSRGDLIAAAQTPTHNADRLSADLVWMAAEPMVPGRAYWLKVGTQLVSASVARVDELVDVNTMDRLSGRPLELNDIGRCEIVLNRALPAVTYAENRRLGGFILIDRATHATVAAGMIRDFPEAADHHGPTEHLTGRIIWLTGSSSDEKRSFALRAQERLEARGRTCFILDDEALREGLNSDLGDEAEAEYLRRAREVARLMSRAGVTVLVAVDGSNESDLGNDVQLADTATDVGDWII